VLNRLTESGTIEATIESSTISDAQNQLRAFVQNALPSSVLFNLTVSNCVEETPSDWVAVDQLATVSNTDGTSFSGSLAVSSTPMIFTSKNDNIYYLVLTLANPGEGTQ
jgi:hypothetical protein